MKEDFVQFWTEFTSDLTEILPSLILGLGVLGLGYLLALLLRKLTHKLVLKLSSELNNRLNISETKINLNDLALFTSRAVFWIILLITFSLFVRVIELKFLNNFYEQSREYLPNIILAVIIVLGGIFAGRFFSRLLETYSASIGLAKRSFVSTAVRYFILFIAFITASDQLGIQVGFLTELIDIILAALLFGVALSFGLGSKDSVGHILASYNLKKDFSIGLKISYENITGRIIKLTNNSVHIDSPKGIIVIPAKEFREGVVVILNEENDEQ